MSLGLYVHIPFCSVKCFYCDFTAFSGQSAAAGRYLEALKVEATHYADQRPQTLYIGGGTPSELSTKELEELFRTIDSSFPGVSFIESTLEANPESLDAEKLGVIKAGGINRLSLGLQTTDDRLLKDIGRRHTFADFVRVYEAARRLGGFQISVDLMYGLPDQSLESLRESLEAVIALQPEHLSLYGLQVEDRTLFKKRGVEPDEALGRAMFDESLDRLAAAGYRHYEISNFAKPGFESAHNLNYWRDGDYIGLGCGAASHLGGARSSNTERLAEYVSRALAGERPVADSERLEGKAKLGERMLLGFRMLEGFPIDDAMRREFGPALDRLSRQGLIAGSALTRDGVFLANRVAREFVAPFS